MQMNIYDEILFNKRDYKLLIMKLFLNLEITY